jgi:hypothetical protein
MVKSKGSERVKLKVRWRVLQWELVRASQKVLELEAG